MDKITAKQNNLRFYTSKKICAVCGTSKRYTSNDNCVECKHIHNTTKRSKRAYKPSSGTHTAIRNKTTLNVIEPVPTVADLFMEDMVKHPIFQASIKQFIQQQMQGANNE